LIVAGSATQDTGSMQVISFVTEICNLSRGGWVLGVVSPKLRPNNIKNWCVCLHMPLNIAASSPNHILTVQSAASSDPLQTDDTWRCIRDPLWPERAGQNVVRTLEGRRGDSISTLHSSSFLASWNHRPLSNTSISKTDFDLCDGVAADYRRSIY
jgi:hypothetical protein